MATKDTETKPGESAAMAGEIGGMKIKWDDANMKSSYANRNNFV